MSTLQALLLGIIQGFTEFLPISSSGHLAIIQHYMGIKGPVIFFDVLLHGGTLAAVVVFFRKELYLIIISIIRFNCPDERLTSERHIVLAIIIGTIPTAFLGVVFYKVKDIFFQSSIIPAAMLLFTGIFLWVGEKYSVSRPHSKQRINFIDALFIGIMQGVALIPGVSRSGTTISSGLIRGLDRELSFRYSFLLFIPAVIGALLLENKTSIPLPSGNFTLPYTAGTLTAFITGIVALALLKKILQNRSLVIFSWYCWGLGGGLILWETIKAIL